MPTSGTFVQDSNIDRQLSGLGISPIGGHQVLGLEVIGLQSTGTQDNVLEFTVEIVQVPPHQAEPIDHLRKVGEQARRHSSRPSTLFIFTPRNTKSGQGRLISRSLSSASSLLPTMSIPGQEARRRASILP